MTPIKVRGKRGAAKAEKWHAGKKRKAFRDSNPASPARGFHTVSAASSMASVPSSRKHKRRQFQLSKLEELPTEILQDIFYYSANLDLALASPGLQAQLSSPHVFLKHACRTLQPVLGRAGGDVADDSVLSAAARLLNCRFMTWDFFKLWLDEQWESRQLPDSTSPGSHTAHEYRRLWLLLEPCCGLLPPRKLLHGPWTEDKINFLSVLSLKIEDLPAVSPVHGEVAHEGLVQAVTESSEAAVCWLLSMSLRSDTELLRRAVIDHGCNKAIVNALVGQSLKHYHSGEHNSEVTRSPSHAKHASAIDFLDPALWAWADKARLAGHSNGEWLMALLRERARAARLQDGALLDAGGGPVVDS